MKTMNMLYVVLIGGGLLSWSSLIWAQQQSPDTILYNGKLVTMNDQGVNDNLGTIAQAIAIKGDKIQAVGTNGQIQALAGPNTRRIDLKGRLVTPAFTITHDHPQDWDPLNPYVMGKAVNDDEVINRFLWDEPPAEKLQKFPRLLEEAVQKAKPGQWIRIALLYGKKYTYSWRGQIEGYFGHQINKQMLDGIAPNNPVIVRTGFLGQVYNSKAIDEIKRAYGDEFQSVFRGDQDEQNGTGFSYRRVERDVIFKPKVLQEIFRVGLDWWAGYGVGANGSAMYSPGEIAAYGALDRRGAMTIRMPWTWQLAQMMDVSSNSYFMAALVQQIGKGSDYLWMVGAWPAGAGGRCSSAPATSPEVEKAAGPCPLDPSTPQGKLNRQQLYNYIKAGGRISGEHTDGDKNMDYLMDVIEQATKDAGMTLDEVRAKRHTWDHLAYNPRPDQIPRIKNLGIMLGGWDLYVWEGRGQQVVKDWGERAGEWVVPRKNLLNAGVRQSIEIDRALGYTDFTFFTVLHVAVTRKDQNGAIFFPQQTVSREAILKSATLSGAYYALREDRMGSLEPGKLADLVVLDRDYLTIPADDIPNVRVLLTFIGGKIAHLVPSLARELGMQPKGAQVELGGNAAKW